MSSQQKHLIVCEEERDGRILHAIMRSLGRESSSHIQAVNRPLIPSRLHEKMPEFDEAKFDIFSKIKRISKDNGCDRVVIVFNLEFGSPISPAPERSILSGMWLAPAVPNVESWLLADRLTFESYHSAASDGAEKRDFPGYLTDSGLHFMNVKEKNKLASRKVTDKYSAQRAAMLSPSLRWLINVTDERADMERAFHFDIGAIILANLVREYYPGDLPLYKSMDGSLFTGGEMAAEIERGTEIGRKYGSDLVRVCRDLLARQAQKYRE